MPVVDSGLQDIVSNDTTNAIVNVMTGPLSSAEIKDARFEVWLCGLTACKVRPGLQWSNDGITWDTAVGIDLGGVGAEYATANGWTFSSGYTDIFTKGSPKLFVRFVIMALNTAGAATEGAQCRLKVRIKPLKARTLVVGPMRIHNKASTSQWVTIVASGPIPAEQCASVRGTVELQSTTGDLEAKVSLETSNTPAVASSWGNATDVSGTTISQNGTNYGSTFASYAPGQDFVRIVIRVRNVSGSDIEAARIVARVDLQAQ